MIWGRSFLYLFPSCQLKGGTNDIYGKRKPFVLVMKASRDGLCLNMFEVVKSTDRTCDLDSDDV